MKKTLSFIAIGLLMGACSSLEEPLTSIESQSERNANFIPLEEALEVADNHFKFMFKGTRADRKVIDAEVLAPHTRSGENGEDSMYGYYIVNYDEGFAMISADRRRSPVVAISEEGSMHLSDTIENKGLALYLNTLQADGRGFDPGLPSQPADSIIYPDGPIDPILVNKVLLADITPKLKGLACKVNQKNGFNQYCLTYIGDRAMTGCTPVSIAQIMSVYKYPESYQGYAFQWDRMEKIDVFGWARVLEILGRPENCNVSYGKDYTDCSFEYMMQTLEHMGYGGPSTNEADWNFENVGFATVAWQIPLIAGGYNQNHLHTWVIDGSKYYEVREAGSKNVLRYDLYLHCVWGKGGTANGYFLFKEDMFGGRPSERDYGTSGSMPKFTGLKFIHASPY